MEELNLVPIYRNGLGEITTGIDVPMPQFCVSRLGVCNKCKDYYMGLETAEAGIYECPYGFSSYVFKMGDESLVFTCLKIVGHYNKSKVNPKVEKEPKTYREILPQTVERYAEAYIQFEKSQDKYDNYKSYVDGILHDIRKFNGDIKVKNTSIFKKSESKPKFAQILQLSKSIMEMNWFMTLRLNNHDFIYNEELMKTSEMFEVNIYRLFDKVKKCLSERCAEKFFKINISSNVDVRSINKYECIELVPYLILDNAIKYSPIREDIEINIKENREYQRVIVKSLGPLCDKNELPKLMEQGFRGENAKKINNGNGIGLYTARRICQLNNIKITIHQDDNVIRKINDIEYAYFCVELIIDI